MGVATGVAAPVATQLARGKTAFQRAEYARAIELLRPLLYPEVRLASEGEMVQTHRMLGVAHLFQRQNDLAAEEFRKLLQLRPDFRMDALIDPPMVVDFFNQVLEQHAAELDELERKRREAEANEEKRRRGDTPCPEPTVIERRTVRNSRIVSFLPFGAGQFQNGQRTKGWWFFTTQVTLGAISLGALTTNFALYGARPTLRCEPTGDPMVREGNCAPGFALSSERERSQMLMRIQLVTGALFFATAIWGVTDAVLNFEPEVVIDQPVGANPAKALRKTSGNSLMVAPTLMFADGVGGTLAFRF
jgi:hypothetical protein